MPRKKKRRQDARLGELRRFPSPPAKHKTGLGVLCRDYPSADVRARIQSSIRAKAKAGRTADDWWQLGEFLVLDGLLDEDDSKINEGIEALKGGADHENPSAACIMDLAWILALRRLDSLALPYAIRATELASDSRDAWSLRAWIHTRLLQKDEAIHAIKQAIALPLHQEADLKLLADLEDPDTDLAAVGRAIILTKLEISDVLSGMYEPDESEKAVACLCSQLLEQDPNNHAAARLSGMARYRLGQFDRAEKLIKQVAEVEPDTEVFTALGLIAGKTDRSGEAEVWYRKAIEADEHNVLALANLAEILQNENRFREARPLLEAALACDDSDPNYHIALDLYGSSIGVLDGDFDLEVEYHRKAVQRDPDRPAFLANLILSLVSAGRPKEAKTLLVRRRKILQSLPNFEALQGIVALYLSDPPSPEACFEAIDVLKGRLGLKAMAPLVKKAWRMRGMVAQENLEDYFRYVGIWASQCGEPELALRIWSIASQHSDLFLLNRAVELSGLGRHQEAIEATDTMPMDRPRSWTIRGNIRLNAGLFDQALASYQEAIAHDESFLLPISNAIVAAINGRRPDLLSPFVDCLRSKWGNTAEGQRALARAVLVQGRPSSSAALFERLLVQDGEIVPPRRLPRDSENDPSIFLQESLEDHYAYYLACYRSGNFERGLEIAAAVAGWAEWVTPDWLALLMLGFHSVGRTEEAMSGLKELPMTSSVLVLWALILRQKGQLAECHSKALEAISADDVSIPGFFPWGRPSAVARALIAEKHLEAGELEKAEPLCKEALAIDPGAGLVIAVWVRILFAAGRRKEVIGFAESALRRCPGDPLAVEACVRLLALHHLPDEARSILRAHDELLCEHGSGELVRQLDQLVEMASHKTSNNMFCIRDIIAAGEGPHIEFKATLRWNIRAGKVDKAIEHEVLKTIVAFHNSEGGTLLVGVEDNGNVLGIGLDDFPNNDKFLLHFTNLLRRDIGSEYARLIDYELHQEGGHQVLVVRCARSSEPVFLGPGDTGEFYIRTGPSSRKLSSRQLITYVREHFKS